MRTIAAGTLLLVTLVIGAAVPSHQEAVAAVPVCPEDAVGVGAPEADYVGGSGWTSMVCIAIDDLR
jgi:hypothetical protein